MNTKVPVKPVPSSSSRLVFYAGIETETAEGKMKSDEGNPVDVGSRPLKTPGSTPKPRTIAIRVRKHSTTTTKWRTEIHIVGWCNGLWKALSRLCYSPTRPCNTPSSHAELQPSHAAHATSYAPDAPTNLVHRRRASTLNPGEQGVGVTCSSTTSSIPDSTRGKCADHRHHRKDGASAGRSGL